MGNFWSESTDILVLLTRCTQWFYFYVGWKYLLKKTNYPMKRPLASSWLREVSSLAGVNLVPENTSRVSLIPKLPQIRYYPWNVPSAVLTTKYFHGFISVFDLHCLLLLLWLLYIYLFFTSRNRLSLTVDHVLLFIILRSLCALPSNNSKSAFRNLVMPEISTTVRKSLRKLVLVAELQGNRKIYPH